MYTEREVHQMTESDIGSAMELWVRGLDRIVPVPELVSYWKENTPVVTEEIRRRIRSGRSAAVFGTTGLEAFAVFDSFPFHGELAAFCPFFGHAAADADRPGLYRLLYTELSGRWVAEGIGGHLITLGARDDGVRDALFDIGFGAYLRDAFVCPRACAQDDTPDPGVRPASQADLPTLYELVSETDGYYRSAPLFLNRDPISAEDVAALLDRGTVHLLVEEARPVGFLYLGQAEEDLIAMIPKDCGVIDFIGAYIRPDFRGKGGGRRLLRAALKDAAEKGMDLVHVDFETANLFGNAFWPKHFHTAMLSVRRVVHPDMTGDA